MSVLWPVRQEQLPAGPGPRGSRQEGRRSRESQRPGAAWEAPEELGWWAAARPSASRGSSFSEGGDTAAPPAVFRTTKVSRQKGPEARKGRGQRGSPPHTWKLLEALRTPEPCRPECGSYAPASPSPAESQEDAHLQLKSHPATPGRVRRMGCAALCVRGPHDVPATLQGQWQGSSLSQSAGTEKPEDSRKRQWAPTETGE